MSRVGSFGQISEINDHLYLSGAHVLKPDIIKKKQISCIVNATVEESANHYYIPGVDHVKIRVDDSPTAPLDAHFDLVADKIKATKDRGSKTLVHCVAGVSRSASLCIAYLIKHENMTLREAYQCVKLARPIIRPNQGFWRQLIDYERRIRGETTVGMVMAPHHSGGIGLWSYDQPVPDVYLNDQKLFFTSSNGNGLYSNTMMTSSMLSNKSSTRKNRSSSWTVANGISSSTSSAGNRREDNNYREYSSSVNSSPSSNLASRLASRYGGNGCGHSNKRSWSASTPSVTATALSALTLANSQVPLPLKSKIKASLFFNSLYDQHSPSLLNDFLFPTF